MRRFKSTIMISYVMVKKKSKASISDRQRKAAYKAWETMKHDRWKRGAETTENIEKFMTLQKVSKIKHPELEPSSTTKTSFLKNI